MLNAIKQWDMSDRDKKNVCKIQNFWSVLIIFWSTAFASVHLNLVEQKHCVHCFANGRPRFSKNCIQIWFWEFQQYGRRNKPLTLLRYLKNTCSLVLWKARWDPEVMIYIFHCVYPDRPRTKIGHPMIVITTGQLKNHDRSMFTIIAGTTYNIAIPCYQSLPGQLITVPSHVYNHVGQVTIIARPWFTTWLRKDFNPDPAMISILTWSVF